MKRVINIVDLLELTLLALIFIRYTDTLTACVGMAFPVILSILYYMIVKVFGPLAQSIPTINTSWLALGDINTSIFVKRRILETAWSYACVLEFSHLRDELTPWFPYMVATLIVLIAIILLLGRLERNSRTL